MSSHTPAQQAALDRLRRTVQTETLMPRPPHQATARQTAHTIGGAVLAGDHDTAQRLLDGRTDLPNIAAELARLLAEATTDPTDLCLDLAGQLATTARKAT